MGFIAHFPNISLNKNCLSHYDSPVLGLQQKSGQKVKPLKI